MRKFCWKEAPVVRFQKIGGVLLLLLLLSGCSGIGAAPPAEADEEELSVAALFQTERGDTLHGSAVCFSTETSRDYCQVNHDGTASISGLPRSGELLLTLFDSQQEVQGAMTLFFDQGAVIDATTGEDGVGYITVREDTGEVALLFVLTENGALQCTLWLAKTLPTNTELPQKGV